MAKSPDLPEDLAEALERRYGKRPEDYQTVLACARVHERLKGGSTYVELFAEGVAKDLRKKHLELQ